ncbi:hypothetical protein M0811_07922 [Anaeramoeba ignava]|uniref:BTB domain-containing protein n=1 Tax=Anaeramoeba ignava TaxID=1746090 RepID=A0A9Q0RDM2_ANAIG|nr:hypothetical protein M0811_07922 [Anaeramoeba ignava]
METYSNLEKLSNDLKNLFQNQNQNENENEKESYFDFEIICEQNKISFKTHKSILSSRSQYFKYLFKSKMKEYQENKMILKDFSSSILSSILSYLYSGKIEFNSENAIQILLFSSKYLIDELIETSSNFIKNNFQFENIVDILKLSESMNLNQLLDSSYRFISENFEKFIKTPFFLELEENHLNSILSIEHFNKLKKWINDDSIFSDMELGFSAKEDGFDCENWHDICDDKGKTLNLAITYYPNSGPNFGDANSYLAGSYDQWEVDELETFFF